MGLCPVWRGKRSAGIPISHFSEVEARTSEALTAVFSPYDAVQFAYEALLGLRAFLARIQVVQEGRDVPSFVSFYSQFNGVFPTKEIQHLWLLSDISDGLYSKYVKFEIKKAISTKVSNL
jgi:hypothetical protein